jgi:hypothetical protein
MAFNTAKYSHTNINKIYGNVFKIKLLDLCLFTKITLKSLKCFPESSHEDIARFIIMRAPITLAE